MKKCANCNSECRSDDIYCRNCGVYIRKKSYYVFLDFLTYVLIIGIVTTLILLIV